MIGRALEWERIHEGREYIVESGMLEEVLYSKTMHEGRYYTVRELCRMSHKTIGKDIWREEIYSTKL